MGQLYELQQVSCSACPGTEMHVTSCIGLCPPLLTIIAHGDDSSNQAISQPHCGSAASHKVEPEASRLLVISLQSTMFPWRAGAGEEDSRQQEHTCCWCLSSSSVWMDQMLCSERRSCAWRAHSSGRQSQLPAPVWAPMWRPHLHSIARLLSFDPRFQRTNIKIRVLSLAMPLFLQASQKGRAIAHHTAWP